MAKVKVWNDNKYPHTEMFKGDRIHIPAGEFIEMDWEEAMEFRGQFTGIKLLGDDSPDPAGFKMIRVEQPKEPIFKEGPLVCHANGEQAVTKEDLAMLLNKFGHMRAPSDPSLEPKSSDDVYEARIKALEAKIEALASPEKKKLGRPFKKEAVA